jgi:hypothetical protein
MNKIVPPDNEDNFDELNGLITLVHGLITLVLAFIAIILGILFI